MRPNSIGNPIGFGGSVTAGVKEANLGDTATHEVGHKGKRRNQQFRANNAGDGTTQQFRTRANPVTAQYNPKELGINKNATQKIPPQATTGFQEISGIGMEKTTRKARRTRHQ